MSDAEQSAIEDLNSTNGVFIKGKRVKHHDLKDGDIIQLGEHKLLYRDLRRRLVPVIDDDDEDGDADDDEDLRNDLADEESDEEEEAEPDERDSGLAERASKT
jgi:pSer/pThr/pTyr-binding forkhead associated (FHA) protein